MTADTRSQDPPRTLARALDLDPRQAHAALAALRCVLTASGEPGASGRRLLAVAAATLEVGDDRPPPASATDIVADLGAELRAAFPSAAARRVLVDALLIPACIEGEVTAAGEARVRALARALGVRSHWVRVLGPLRRRRVFAVKRQLYPRAPDGRRILRRTWAEEGLPGIWRALRFVLGLHVDPPLAARFRALATLPPDSLGGRFFADFAARGLAFPGEPRGLPERMIHHDLMHVVNDYTTEPAGECELAGFYAGFADGDAFTFIVIALATFHLGLPVSPPMVLPARGAFDPARVLAAFLRGRRLRVDVMGPWDYWALMPLPLAEVRARLGIADPPPADQSAA